MRFGFIQPPGGDQIGEVGGINTTGNVVAGRNRAQGAGVVVEADGVVEAGGFGNAISR